LKNSFQLRRQFPSVIARFMVDAMNSFLLFCVSFGSLHSFTAVTPAKSYLPRNCFLPPLTLPGLLWEAWELFLKPKPSHSNQLKRSKGSRKKRQETTLCGCLREIGIVEANKTHLSGSFATRYHQLKAWWLNWWLDSFEHIDFVCHSFSLYINIRKSEQHAFAAVILCLAEITWKPFRTAL